ncbi:gastrula zinc finger protein 5-1-like [Nylanderia fulva]|uniref:gastrula zinc finger protein 5-1-like n=1 Tax=Nylanderia fulva TaxID=613905 RepID=UPI0010FAF621|nr:gastrula zinc finger protein 5-1-like [Nylanderia fulva]
MAGRLDQKTFVCHLCGRKYFWKASLHRHLREECGTFNCKEYNKSYKAASSLKRHQNHQKPNVFNCKECNKSYKNPSSLKRHQKTECKSSVKCPPFVCQFCAYRSAQKTNVERHVEKRHAEEYDDYKEKKCQNLTL